MMAISNQKLALADSIRRAAAQLAGVDLAARCGALGLPAPAADGTLRFRMLGRTVELRPPDFIGVSVDPPGAMHEADRLLALHYLVCEKPVRPTGRWVTFREFPGGLFYWDPFVRRTAEPLVRAIGSDLALLGRRLSRFDWTPMDYGDLGARVHVVGRAEIGLVYRRGDAEFPPAADILFDESLLEVYGAEDAAEIAGRVCLCLCGERCGSCGGMGLCDRGAGDHCR
jgi:hypothetical protein